MFLSLRDISLFMALHCFAIVAKTKRQHISCFPRITYFLMLPLGVWFWTWNLSYMLTVVGLWCCTSGFLMPICFIMQPGMPLEHSQWSIFPFLKGHLSFHLQEFFPNKAREEKWSFFSPPSLAPHHAPAHSKSTRVPDTLEWGLESLRRGLGLFALLFFFFRSLWC